MTLSKVQSDRAESVDDRVIARRIEFGIEQLELIAFRFDPRHAHGAIVPPPQAER